MSQSKHKGPSNSSVILFIVVLSFVCALVLSSLASVLAKTQETARKLDRSEQMLMAAQIYSPNGYFVLPDKEGHLQPAKVEKDGTLVPGTEEDKASKEEVLTVFNKRIQAFLIDDEGNEKTFAEAGLDEADYTAENQKDGYADLPLKLAYKILANEGNGSPVGYVIPVNGFGLWDAIYGYLAIKPDAVTIIGITWYEHIETPGLGAVISEASWQSQFPDKKIFNITDPSDDISRLPVGVTVVRGKVSEVIGTGPKADTAVDGIPGATLTGNGVSKAFQDVLDQYRPFLVKVHKESLATRS